MLPQPYRLTKNKEFDQVFTKGKAYYTDCLGVKCAKNGLEISRFGILTGTKVSKKAVIRNKIKRRIRQALITQMDLLKSGYDCAIICRPPVVKKDYQDILKLLQHSFSKLKLYKKPL
ncbi:MAG: ribonuclease P protein component [Patescibacteria group bacterium]|jgi:ribonuclease P protein component